MADVLSSIGPVSSAERARAESQLASLDRINNRSGVIVRRYSTAIQAASLHALNTGQTLQINEQAEQLIIDQLVGLSVLSYVVGKQTFGNPDKVVKSNSPIVITPRREATTYIHRLKNISFSFGELPPSAFNDDIKRIAGGFELDLGRLSDNVTRIVSPRVKESLKSVRSRINDSLAELTADKVPTYQATRILKSRLTEMGVTPNSSSYVETLVRTHTQLTYNAAQHLEFQKDDDIWGYKYVTVGDNRVRPAHEKLDGLTRKKDDSVWKIIWPPNGWNCRCQPLALYDSERQTRLPNDVSTLPDAGFRFNPGLELA